MIASIGALATMPRGRRVAEAREAGDWSAPGLAAAEGDSPRFVKVESGVLIQEVKKGIGRSVEMGDRVEVDYVLRRSNGYFIYSTVEGVSFQPKDVPIGAIEVDVGGGEWIAGWTDALVGMQVVCSLHRIQKTRRSCVARWEEESVDSA